MYNIPEMYKKESIINKKKFTPKKETSYNKKKIRENLKRIKLKYQIDRDIPSLINETYNIQVIMYLEVELKSMKHRTYINEFFQKLLKGYVIIKYICDDKVSLGYGYKRLNKYDVKDVLLENSFVTEEFQEVFFFDNYLLYEKYLNFEKIKNKTNKLEFYLENMVKAYIISNKTIVKNYSDILKSNIFYNIKPTLKIYKTLENLVDNHAKVKAKKTTPEKIELNKKIANLNKELEDLLNE